MNGLGVEGRLAVQLVSSVEGTVDLAKATGQRLAVAGQVGRGGGRDGDSFRVMAGPSELVRSYSESLLKMVTGANGTDALRSHTRVNVAASIAEIVADVDPPLASRGRVS